MMACNMSSFFFYNVKNLYSFSKDTTADSEEVRLDVLTDLSWNENAQTFR